MEQHAHFWRIDSTGRGVCKHCRHVRHFPATFDDALDLRKIPGKPRKFYGNQWTARKGV